METVKYRMQLRERGEGAMGSLRKLNGLRGSEQSLDETIQLLPANQGGLRARPSLVSRISIRTSRNGLLRS